MPLIVNIRHLERRNLRLKGRLPVADLDIETNDEVIQVRQPLDYDLEAQLLDDAVLVRGHVRLILDCECVRCLKPVKHVMDLPDWACHLPLKGEEKIVVTNDCIDLTPYVREDILLAFPQHPLCGPGCDGLPKTSTGSLKTRKKTSNEDVPSPWTELDKLKL